MNPEANVCPGCENHCPQDQLRCPKGLKHFGDSGRMAGGPSHGEADLSRLSPDEAVIQLMRKCGHYLHHSAGQVDSGALLSALSDDEKRQLVALLDKCAKNWQ